MARGTKGSSRKPTSAASQAKLDKKNGIVGVPLPVAVTKAATPVIPPTPAPKPLSKAQAATKPAPKSVKK